MCLIVSRNFSFYIADVFNPIVSIMIERTVSSMDETRI